MAYGSPKYSITFQDEQGRTHDVYLALDGDDTSPGEDVALEPTDDPLIYRFGSSSGDPFAVLHPTALEIEFIATDDTVFADIFGDDTTDWLVTWEIASTEVWRGYLVTDEIEQPIDLPSVVKLRAVCGLVNINADAWSPLSAARQTFMVGIADCLSNTGVGYTIASAANWHATPNTGNTYAVYEFHPRAFRSTEGEEYMPPGGVLAQLVGRFGGRVFQANGKWWVVQRERMTGSSYTAQTYDTSGAAVSSTSPSRLSIAVAGVPMHAGAILGGTQAYDSAAVYYSHGELSRGLFDNMSFDIWSGSATGPPDSWEQVDEDTSTTPDAGSIISQYVSVPSGGPRSQVMGARAKYGVLIADKYTGTVVDAVGSALVGIKQDSNYTVPSGARISFQFQHKLEYVSSPSPLWKMPRPAFYSIWINGTTDYYWSAADRQWVSGTIPTHTDGGLTESVPDAAKIMYHSGSNWESEQDITDRLPGADTYVVRFVFYNAVDTLSANNDITGIVIDNLDVSVEDPDNPEYQKGRLEERAIAQAPTGARAEYKGGEFFVGQGPTEEFHYKKITYGGGTYADDWAKTNGAGATGKTLGRVHAEQMIDALFRPGYRLRCRFRVESGDYWPYMPISYDSVEFICSSVSYSARWCEYDGEWTEQFLGSTTPTFEQEGWIGSNEPYWVFPDDMRFWKLPEPQEVFDMYETKGPGGGVPDNIPDKLYAPKMGSSWGSIFQRLGIGDNPSVDELLNLRSDGGDALIRFQTVSSGSDSVYLLGVDKSDSNAFVIAEATDLDTTPTATAGPRLKIDANGNFTINEGTRDSSYYFELDGQTFDTTGYGNSGGLTFRAHYWTGSADASQTVSILAKYESAALNDYYLAIDNGFSAWRFDYLGTWGVDGVGGYLFPAADGSPNQVLQTDGSGTVSWATVSGGASALDDLSDVTITTPDTGALLYKSAGDWIDMAAGTSTQVLIGGTAPAFGSLNLGTMVTGTLGETSGGTGQTTYTAGDILYSDGANSLGKLAAGTSTQVLHGGTTPGWGAVSLTASVSGTLPTGNGGTGVSSYTAGDILYYASGTALSKLAAGTSSQVLHGGTTPSWSALDADNLTGVTAIGNDWTWGGAVGLNPYAQIQTDGDIVVGSGPATGGTPQKDSPVFSLKGSYLSGISTDAVGTITLNVTGTGSTDHQLDLALTGSETLSLQADGTLAWTGDDITVNGTSVALSTDVFSGSVDDLTGVNDVGADWVWKGGVDTTFPSLTIAYATGNLTLESKKDDIGGSANDSPVLRVHGHGIDGSDVDYPLGWKMWTDAIVSGTGSDFHARLDAERNSVTVGTMLFDANDGSNPFWQFDQRVLLASGSASLPGLGFSSDPDTGLHYSATQINFDVAGTARAYVSSTAFWFGTAIPEAPYYKFNDQSSEPSGTAAYGTLYADASEVPKWRVNTQSSSGVPIVWWTRYADGSDSWSSSGRNLIANAGGSTTGTLTLPASHLLAGQTYRIKVQLYLSDDAATGDTFWFILKLGSTELVNMSTQTFTLGSTETGYVDLEGHIVVESVAAGTAQVRGFLRASWDGSASATVTHIKGQTGTSGITVASTQDVQLVHDCTSGGPDYTLTILHGQIEQLY